MSRAHEMRRGVHSAQGSVTKRGTPVVRGYGSTHGTPVIGIYLERTPRMASHFNALVSPSYSDVTDDSPESSPVKADYPPLYSIELEPPVQAPAVHEIPLIPIPSPKLHARTFSGSSLLQQRTGYPSAPVERRMSIALPVVGPITIPRVPYDVRRTILSQLGRNGFLRRVLTFAIIAGTAALFLHSLSSAFTSSRNGVIGNGHAQAERARARTLLNRDPTRHAAVGEDQAAVHFVGADAHAHRAEPVAPVVRKGVTRGADGRRLDTKADEARSWRDLPSRRRAPRIAKDDVTTPRRRLGRPLGRAPPLPADEGLPAKPALAPVAPLTKVAPHVGDPRSWSAAAAARAVDARLQKGSNNVRPAGRSPQQQLAGGLAYPGLIEARRAAAEAYRAAVGRRGATDAAKRAAKLVVAAAVVAERDPIQGALTRPGSVIAPAAVAAMRRDSEGERHPSAAAKATTLFEGLGSGLDAEPAETDDTPEKEAAAQDLEDEHYFGSMSLKEERRMAKEAMDRMRAGRAPSVAERQKAKLPLRLMRFADERFSS